MNINSEDYIGNKKQLNGVYSITLNEGKASGMKCYRVYTESGLSLLVMIDRGMDIGELKVDGKNISFMSSTGLVNSSYFVENGQKGFMNNFNVGFLTTGGLSYTGPSENPDYGLHGVISNTPAENYGYTIETDKIIIHGYIKESRMFGPNLSLHREIIVYRNTKEIRINDVLTNENDIRSDFMLLYHVNFGYPFFTPNLKLVMHPKESYNRNYSKAVGWDKFNEPKNDEDEIVYFHKLSSNNQAKINLTSPDTNLGLEMSFDPKVLPIINQWKLQRTKNYVLGIEPSTNDVNGPEMAKQRKEVLYLDPNESKRFNLKFNFEKLEDKE